MQLDNAVLFTVPVSIGDTRLEGQVLAPVIRLKAVHAPSQKVKAHRIEIEVYIDPDDAPSPDDCGFIMPGSRECKLKDVQVLLVFEEGTISTEASRALAPQEGVQG